jgi:hypothetical protein
VEQYRIEHFERRSDIGRLRSPQRCLRRGQPAYFLHESRAANRDPKAVETVRARIRVQQDDEAENDEKIDDLVLAALNKNSRYFRAEVIVGDSTSGNTIRIKDEDMVTISLRDDSHISLSVMLDMREAGIDYCEDYEEYLEKKRETEPDATRPVNIVAAESMRLAREAIEGRGGRYALRFYRRDSRHSRGAWRADGDRRYAKGLTSNVGADTVDVAMLLAHGNQGTIGFSRTAVADPSLDDYRLLTSDLQFGDLDMEFAATWACLVLETPKDEWDPVLSGGAHVVLGWASVCVGVEARGKTFVEICYHRSPRRPRHWMPVRDARYGAEVKLRRSLLPTLYGKDYVSRPRAAYFQQNRYSALACEGNNGWVRSPDWERATERNRVEFYTGAVAHDGSLGGPREE